MNIGFIGLGKMGSPMTRNLLKAGYKVNIYDKNPSTFKPTIDLGANEQNSIKDVGSISDCIFIMVYPPEMAFEIIFDECKGLLAGIKGQENNKKKNNKHPIIIDGGNADYTNSRQIGQRLDKLGIHYMDIGFSGGPGAAEKAKLTAFVGGDHKVFKEIRPVLSALCNKNKINYIGGLGSGHFAKVIAHNTIEYGVMQIIGEIASLSNEVGDHRKIMMAVNNGLAETRLGYSYLKLLDKDIENTGCKIDVTQNAAELALREAKKGRIGIPLISIVYYLRKMSKELYETNGISDKTKNDMIQELLNQFNEIELEYKKKGTVRSMAIQAQLRKVFGGHTVYKKKIPYTS
jgi:3-hydroxyisobutyrate dehydrogenase-like beta-hydroxyacid dehydrogenase